MNSFINQELLNSITNDMNKYQILLSKQKKQI